MSGLYGIGKAFGSIFGLKEGGEVLSPFMEALRKRNMEMARGGGLFRPVKLRPYVPPAVQLKKGGVVKKTKAKKGKKKGKGKDKK